MTDQPREYDRRQDQRLDGLESLISAEYRAPEGVEYSFPVANQGITQEQFRLMNLSQPNGLIHSNTGTVNESPDSTGYRYYLEGHDSDSETNQRNTLMLRAGTSAESIVEGFYHRLTEDLELPFPAVTSTTLYHVTLTYDPRNFRTSPVKIEVWPGQPPAQSGQIHVLLNTVERRPNQLLSQATITRYRQYTAGVVSVQNTDQLPDPSSLPAGTLAVPSSDEATGIYVRSNTGPRRWANTLAGPWQRLSLSGGWIHSTPQLEARMTVLGVQMRGRVNGEDASNIRTFVYLPPSLRPSTQRRVHAAVHPSGRPSEFVIHPNGDVERVGSQASSDTRVEYINFDNILFQQ